jgi:hypothetical protein
VAEKVGRAAPRKSLPRSGVQRAFWKIACDTANDSCRVKTGLLRAYMMVSGLMEGMAMQRALGGAILELDDDEPLPEDQQEELADLTLTEDWFAGPSLWGTDWTTETIVNQLRRGNINMNPRFQRRNAWTNARKSLFVESLILGLPVPQIILAEDRTRKGSNFIVIDGKQRLLTLRQFSARPEGDDFEQLRLTGLENRKELNGLTYETLQANTQFANELNIFENQTIRTVVIRGWRDERYLYSVFLRINTGSVQLSAQELRQALHPGGFSDFIDDVSVEHSGIRQLLKLKAPDFRMRDVELVLRYFAYLNFGFLYNGDLKAFLDDTTQKLNKAWPGNTEMLREQADELDNALKRVREIFGERNEVRKWNGRMYEKKINRAVFDIMVCFFANRRIRNASVGKEAELEERFKSLCERDREFLASLEQTTKSREANRIRFSTWAEALANVLGVPVESPLDLRI